MISLTDSVIAIFIATKLWILSAVQLLYQSSHNPFKIKQNIMKHMKNACIRNIYSMAYIHDVMKWTKWPHTKKVLIIQSISITFPQLTKPDVPLRSILSDHQNFEDLYGVLHKEQSCSPKSMGLEYFWKELFFTHKFGII